MAKKKVTIEDLARVNKIRAHENRIEKLEDEVRVLKTLVGNKS